MKFLLYIPLLLSVCLLFSCHREQETNNPYLLKAERLMECHPDSALALLGTIQAQTLGEASDSALYTLLLTQAQYKNFIDPTDTLPISRAAEYYQAHPANRRHLMLSLYYKGVVLYNAGHYDRAIQPLLDAEKTAISLGDHFYLGLIYRSISMVFGAIYDNSNELIYSYKAWQSFVNSGNEEYALSELCSHAISLNNSFLYDEAILLLKEFGDPIHESGDSVTIYSWYQALAMSHLGKGEYSAAIRNFDAAQRYGFKPDNQDLQLISKAYDKNLEYAKADSVYHLLANKGADIILLPENALCSRNDYRKAYESQKKYAAYTDSIFRIIVQQQVTKNIIAYKEQERRNLLAESQSRHQRLLFLCGFIGLGLFGAIVYLLYSRKRQLKKTAHKMAVLHDITRSLHRQLSESKEEYHAFTQQASSILTKQLKELDSLCSDYYVHSDQKNSYYKNLVLSTIEHLRDEANFTDCLLADFDRLNHNLISDLRNSDIHLSSQDWQFLAYILFGFSYSSISLLLSKDNAALYRMKYRLKLKISASDFVRKSEILSYLS